MSIHTIVPLTIIVRWNSKTPSSVIKCIHRVENVELWRGYCAKRDAIERLRGDANECWYWHGTRQLSPEIIAKEGFDFRVANSGYYGRGAYFAHSVNYSANSYYYVIQQAPAQLPQTPNNPFQTPNRAIRRIISPSRHSHPFPAPVSPIPAPNPPGQQSPGTFQSIMEFPPGVGAGDSQLILARVCVGNTIVMPSNNQVNKRIIIINPVCIISCIS